MSIISKLKEEIHAIGTVHKISKEQKDPIEERKHKRDETRVTLVRFTYDEGKDCYIYNEDTKARMKDVPSTAVHVTGKKRMYFYTDLWDELIWPKEGQSAIHMYLWMINTKINPESITEKKRPGGDIDWKKLLMYVAIGIVVIVVAMSFMGQGGTKP